MSRLRTPSVLWYAAGAVAAIAVGYIAAGLNRLGFVPIGLFSLSVGCLLGGVLGAVAALVGMACRTRLIIGTILLALGAIGAEHAWLYADFRRQWHEARTMSAEAAMFRTESPWSAVEYFGREISAGRAALWILDTALVIAGAITTVVILPRYITNSRVDCDAAELPTPDP